jgi:protein-S-isoprenylcysteine O-methyltransferase Ste14
VGSGHRPGRLRGGPRWTTPNTFAFSASQCSYQKLICQPILVGSWGARNVARFALEGLGTPAPIAPPQKLVVTGLYRYVRNPIYIAVVAVIFGQALLFGEQRLLWYGALLWLFFHVWVVLIEEPTLKQTFGAEYESFRTNVPRWIPRLTPWRTA